MPVLPMTQTAGAVRWDRRFRLSFRYIGTSATGCQSNHDGQERLTRRRRSHCAHLQLGHRGSHCHIRNPSSNTRRRPQVVRRHPIVVVENGGEVLAFAATSDYRPRECYAGITEFSVYVARAARRREMRAGCPHSSCCRGRLLEIGFANLCRKRGQHRAVPGARFPDGRYLLQTRSVGW